MKKRSKLIASLLIISIIASLSTCVFASEPLQVTSNDSAPFIEIDLDEYTAQTAGYRELPKAIINAMFSGTESYCVAPGEVLDFRNLIPSNAIVTSVKIKADRSNVQNGTYDYKLLVANTLSGINPVYTSVNMPQSGQYATISAFNSTQASRQWFVSFSCRRLNTNQLTGATIKNVKLRIEYTY